MSGVEVIAWRGNSHIHWENTVEAATSVPGFVRIQEIDTRLTSDGKLIAYHSPTMKVHGDPRKVEDITFAEIEKKRIVWHRREYRIPLVSDIIAASPSTFMLHVKREVDIATYLQEVERLPRPCLFHSNSEPHLRALKDSPSSLGVLKSIYTPAQDVLDYVDGYMCGHNAFMPVTSLEDWWVSRLRDCRKLIYVFAGSSLSWIKEVLSYDIDGFLTNRFDRAIQAMPESLVVGRRLL